VYISKEDAASPTVMTKSILLTATIKTKKGLDVMTGDIPDAFIQTDMEVIKGVVIMKIKGDLINMVVELDIEMYRNYVVIECNFKVIYVQVLKVIWNIAVITTFLQGFVKRFT
jgi:hypothetical protein